MGEEEEGGGKTDIMNNEVLCCISTVLAEELYRYIFGYLVKGYITCNFNV